MHQTTLRFGPDLWEAVGHEADRLGVSVSQYVRDATVARLLEARFPEPRTDAARNADGGRARLSGRVDAQLSSAEAVRAQGRLAHKRAQGLRAKPEVLRSEHPSPVG
jgi:hypothetical protein